MSDTGALDGSADHDGDGWPPPEDCADHDPRVFPGAAELPYDGIDQDCDGLDETDVDGDGHAAAVVGGDDCNDVDATVHGGAAERCGNLLDDDCDGLVDGGCPGTPAGSVEPGGIWWVCGVAPSPPGPLWALVFLAVLWRRRAAALR